MIKHILALFTLVASAFAQLPGKVVPSLAPELQKFIDEHIDPPIKDLFHWRHADNLLHEKHDKVVRELHKRYQKLPTVLMSPERDVTNEWAAVSCTVRENTPYVQLSVPTLMAEYGRILKKYPEKVANKVFEQTLLILYLHALDFLAAGYGEFADESSGSINLMECLVWAETCRSLIAPMAEAGRTMGDTEFSYYLVWVEAGKQTFSQSWLDFFTKQRTTTAKGDK